MSPIRIRIPRKPEDFLPKIPTSPEDVADPFCVLHDCDDKPKYKPEEIMSLDEITFKLPVGGTIRVRIPIPKEEYLKSAMQFHAEEFTNLEQNVKDAAQKVLDEAKSLNEKQIKQITETAEAISPQLVKFIEELQEEAEKIAKEIVNVAALAERRLNNPNLSEEDVGDAAMVAGCATIVRAICVVLGGAILKEHPILGKILIEGAWGFGVLGCGLAYKVIKNNDDN